MREFAWICGKHKLSSNDMCYRSRFHFSKPEIDRGKFPSLTSIGAMLFRTIDAHLQGKRTSGMNYLTASQARTPHSLPISHVSTYRKNVARTAFPPHKDPHPHPPIAFEQTPPPFFLFLHPQPFLPSPIKYPA